MVYRAIGERSYKTVAILVVCIRILINQYINEIDNKCSGVQILVTVLFRYILLDKSPRGKMNHR